MSKRREAEVAEMRLKCVLACSISVIGGLLPLWGDRVLAETYRPQTLAIAAQLETIERRGYLIVAVKDNLRPLGFRDANGNLQGLEIEIARRLATELLGSPDAVRLQPVTNQQRLSAVLDGSVDLAIARVSLTEPRLRIVSFSDPYYIDGTGFVTKDSSVRQLRDIDGQTVAVLNGSSTIADLRYVVPTAELVGVESYRQALMLLESGAAGVFAADASVLAGWVQEYPNYRLLPVLISAEALAIAMPKGLQFDRLRQRVNRAIAGWKAAGWLKERARYWGLPVSQ